MRIRGYVQMTHLLLELSEAQLHILIFYLPSNLQHNSMQVYSEVLMCSF